MSIRISVNPAASICAAKEAGSARLNTRGGPG
ncbi:MAG: hypothetical protein ACI9K2_006334, partial [Myxococcota bacterium]